MLFVVPKCDNCGNPNHFSPKCPKPRDDEKCKKARKHGQRHGTLREAEVVKAVEVEVATEVVQVVGLVLEGSMLLGTVQQKATTLE